jgi:hypothetical protein
MTDEEGPKMESSIKPQALMGHILPGFLLLAVFLYFLVTQAPDTFEKIDKVSSGVAAIGGVSLFLLVWLLGHICDTIRNICEYPLDWMFVKPAERKLWKSFYAKERDKVELLERYYYSYYVLDMNCVVANVILFLASAAMHWVNLIYCSWFGVLLIVSTVVFLVDAALLRHEMVERVNGR